jgi:hypothetical protein
MRTLFDFELAPVAGGDHWGYENPDGSISEENAGAAADSYSTGSAGIFGSTGGVTNVSDCKGDASTGAGLGSGLGTAVGAAVAGPVGALVGFGIGALGGLYIGVTNSSGCKPRGSTAQP